MAADAHLDLTGTADAAREARIFALATLYTWDRGPSARVLEIVVSELVTNAVRHAPGPIAIDMSIEGDIVRFAVSDRFADRSPQMRSTPLGSVSGFGLHIVEELSTNWGYRANDSDGKTVWADVDLNRRL